MCQNDTNFNNTLRSFSHLFAFSTDKWQQPGTLTGSPYFVFNLLTFMIVSSWYNVSNSVEKEQIMEQSTTDAALMQQAAKGDAAAMSALWKKYSDAVYQSMLEKQVDPALCRRVTQEAFLHAYAVLRTDRAISNFFALVEICAEKQVRLALCIEPAKSTSRSIKNSTQPIDEAVSRREYSDASDGMTERGKKRLLKKENRRGNPVARGIFIVLFILFDLLLVWLLAGFLMQRGILPKIDLGYEWMYQKVYLLLDLLKSKLGSSLPQSAAYGKIIRYLNI